MSTFERMDFSETVAIAEMRLGIKDFGKDIERVTFAWGESVEGWGEWSGGFILKLQDGEYGQQRYAYAEGWCDTSGWGCQDGVTVTFYEHRITPKDVEREFDGGEQKDWAEEPEDLNLLIAEWRENEE